MSDDRDTSVDELVQDLCQVLIKHKDTVDIPTSIQKLIELVVTLSERIDMPQSILIRLLTNEMNGVSYMLISAAPNDDDEVH